MRLTDVFLGAVGGIVLGAMTDMLGEEFRTRLDRVPQGLLRLSVRLLPHAKRERYVAEGLAELHEILRGADAVPVTRLLCGLRYSAGWAFAAVRIRLAEHRVKSQKPVVAPVRETFIRRMDYVQASGDGSGLEEEIDFEVVTVTVSGLVGEPPKAENVTVQDASGHVRKASAGEAEFALAYWPWPFWSEDECDLV